jgi:hypothetical protein
MNSLKKKEYRLPKVHTFTSELTIFKTKNQLEELDKKVNDFIIAQSVEKIYSASDTTTQNESGATMGIIRVIVYD